MRVLFVGGANEVGASCLAIELADQWIVVDAGVRVGRQADELPDLALLQDKKISAIFVTHAHADHIGALPLLHQAFPHVPIYASRGTALLMEVMLADVVKIMARRAVDEMELPLYAPELVARMLNQVRPLPVDEAITIPALAGITVYTSYAGHIAGAISLGFAAADGSIVVSGDVSRAEQRTVGSAIPPSLKQPDLLVLEATYGAKLHANRQAEESRLAQAVAEGITQRKGHVLIPCFSLGRGQEVLLLLVEAQQKGLIPTFPIIVDGLVRRVCSTYHLLPEALTARLARQIRKGYYPFVGSRITFVRDEQDRTRILAGQPACIVSSSGMLTGGPSVWYATQLAAQAQATILITSYQDEESPGRHLLDVAEGRKSTLELAGRTVQLHCQVAKYGLSAHADAGELAAYAAAVQARNVALVHGEDEARAALRVRLTDTRVLLPANGAMLSFADNQEVVASTSQAAITSLAELPAGIGGGMPFELEQSKKLWEAVVSIPFLRIVTARELALIWYGQVSEATTEHMLNVLKQDVRARYFVPYSALEEAWHVRRAEDASGDLFNALVGQILFMQLDMSGTQKPALCRALQPTASVRLIFAPGLAQRRYYPCSAILDVLGPLPESINEQEVPTFLAELNRQALAIRATLAPARLALSCEEARTYTLEELSGLAEVSSTDLAARLAVAKLLQRASDLFYMRQAYISDENGFCGTNYGLTANWRDALAQYTPIAVEERVPAKSLASNQVLEIIERAIGQPDDLYRRRINQTTGEVTLSFHFPDIARELYQEVLYQLSDEIGIEITISPHPHQSELEAAARAVLPATLSASDPASVLHEKKQVRLTVRGRITQRALSQAQAEFQRRTGWSLAVVGGAAKAPVEQLKYGMVAAPAEPNEREEHTALPAVPDEERVLPAILLDEGRAQELVYAALSEQYAVRRICVDAVRHILLVQLDEGSSDVRVDAAILSVLTEQSGWLIEVANAPVIQPPTAYLPDEQRLSSETAAFIIEPDNLETEEVVITRPVSANIWDVARQYIRTEIILEGRRLIDE